MHPLSWTACLLSAIGAINWGLTKFFAFNLVEYLGEMIKIDYFTQVIYGLVALSGFYVLVSLFIG